jgi:hypothetical protein
MLANLVHILNLTPVLGGSLVGKGSVLGFNVLSSLETDSMNKSWSNWAITLTSWFISLFIFY